MYASGMYPSEHRYHLAPRGQDLPTWHTSCPHEKDAMILKGWRLVFTDENYDDWECNHA